MVIGVLVECRDTSVGTGDIFYIDERWYKVESAW